MARIKLMGNIINQNVKYLIVKFGWNNKNTSWISTNTSWGNTK